MQEDKSGTVAETADSAGFLIPSNDDQTILHRPRHAIFQPSGFLIPSNHNQTTPAIPVSIGLLTYSRGSVMCPVSALAATVNGDAR